MTTMTATPPVIPAGDTITERFMRALRIDPWSDRASGLLRGRLIGLGHGDVCGRCGGTGNHSYNPMYGSVCYGCAGAGQKMPILTGVLLAKVVADVAAGKLDAYIAAAIAKQEAKRLAKLAGDAPMAAWKASGVGDAYDWRKAAEQARAGQWDARDRVISDRFNKPMCTAYERVEKVRLDLIGATASNDREAIAHLQERLIAESKRAVAEIDALAVELRAWLNANPV